MYTAPSTEEIIQDLRNSVQAEVAGTDPWIWPNNLVPVLKAFGQAHAHGLPAPGVHPLSRPSSPPRPATTSTGTASRPAGSSRNPSTFAQGPISCTATLGTVVYDGTQFARSDGQLFICVGSTTATTPTLNLFVRAVDSR